MIKASAEYLRFNTQRVSSSSIGVFRALYGAVMSFSLLRFIVSGWVEELWVKPDFFFKYEWAAWMPVWSPTGLYIHVSLTLLGAIGVMLGLYFKRSLLIFIIGFTTLQLMDQTNYLNHYYLVICLALPLMISPAGETFSLDCLWRGRPRREYIERWYIDLLRFQIGIVYLFAAIAKMSPDWLLYGQPLSIWLSSRTDLPLLGSIFNLPYTGLLMSWGGFLYDLLIVPALLWSQTRSWAYGVVVIFHGMTWMLFDIGIFPLLMTLMTPIFFAPDWPRRLLKGQLKEINENSLQANQSTTTRKIPQSMMIILGMWCSFHLLFPLRGFWLDENIVWSERGMRYSWRVMVREKMGSLTYRVRSRETGREWEVNPRVFLQPRQLSEMSGQPDMIIQLSHWVRQHFEAKIGHEVEVYADAWVSLNGRASQRLINPSLDLTRHSTATPGLILSAPTSSPLKPW